jgi:hypothetical protein
VVAKVERVESCIDRLGSIFTYVTFSQAETLEKEGAAGAPDAPGEFTLRVPGGMVDGMVEVVTDAPVFRPGDRVLLFLTRDPQQQVPVVNGAQGVLLITPAGFVLAYSGAPVVGVDKEFRVLLDGSYRPSPADARHWDPNMVAVWKEAEPARGPGMAPPAPRPRPPMSLSSFRVQLRRAWQEADRIGRLPEKLDYSPRRPYGEVPRAQGDPQ